MSEGKHKKDRDRAHPHEGSVAPTDPELATWLRTFWARDEYPTRLELWQVFGRNGLDRGHQIFVEDFKGGKELDPEQVAKLANEVLAAAQHDTDCRGVASLYQIDVIDPHRSAKPIIRRLGPLHPQQSYLEKIGSKPGAAISLGDEEDGEGLALNGRTLSLAYIKEGHDRLRWREGRNDKVIGEVVELLGIMVQELRASNAQLMQGHMTFFLQLQEALDRSKERERQGAWTDMKVEMARDGLRAGRNLVFGFFGPSADRGAPKLAGANGVLGSLKEKIAFQIDKNSERSLIDGFLNDCEKAGILTKLFGEWTEQGPVRDKPGIFSFEQAAILVKVRDGELPPEVIDQILPGMGGAFEITFEQINRAQPLIPEGMGQALLELRDLRERRRVAAAAAAAPAAAPAAPATQPSAPGAADER